MPSECLRVITQPDLPMLQSMVSTIEIEGVERTLKCIFPLSLLRGPRDETPKQIYQYHIGPFH